MINSSSAGRARGRAGTIELRVGQLNLSRSGEITSETTSRSRGDAGEVIIRAERIDMTGWGSRIRSVTRGRGDAGLVHIEAEHFRLSRGRIQGGSFGGSQGSAGDVVIIADTLIVENEGRIASVLGSPGAGGNVNLTVHDLIVRSGGQVRASIEVNSPKEIGFESGDAGSLTIEATGRVEVTGENSVISSLTRGTGDAGRIVIHADQLVVTDHGQITSETLTSGNGGNITIQANEIRIADHGVINTHSSSQSDDAGAGGDIAVTAQEVIRLQDSEITTSVIGGEKRGGNIVVRAPVGLFERSRIQANAFGGPGGNISIQTQGLITDNTSAVTASSALNVDGTVDIEGFVDITGALKPINQQFAQGGALLQNRCATRRRQQRLSRFLVRGRDRTTLDPSGPLPTPLGPPGDTAQGHSQERRPDRPSQPGLSHLALAQSAWLKDCVH